MEHTRCSRSRRDSLGQASGPTSASSARPSAREVDTLIVVGATTSVCVESTVRDATFRDDRCLVVEDCTAEPIGADAARTNQAASMAVLELLFAWITNSAAVVEALASAPPTSSLSPPCPPSAEVVGPDRHEPASRPERLSGTVLRPELAPAQLLYGEWLRRGGRRIDAREQLRRAHEAFSTIGMEAFAERARRELVATGMKVRKRSEEGRFQLTPQEDQIARLARDGLSNPEIGAQLFISSRTVEWHLGKGLHEARHHLPTGASGLAPDVRLQFRQPGGARRRRPVTAPAGRLRRHVLERLHRHR